MRADVAILIVSYNTRDELVGLLRSIEEQRRSVRQQIIVFDNASRDGSVEAVRSEFPQVELIASGTNLGFAAGVNAAAARADADYLLLLNPDMVVLDHAIDELVDFARRNPRYGVYGGRTVRRDGSLEPSSCWGLPTVWSTLAWTIGLRAIARSHPILDPESLGRWQRDTVREVGVITGCLLLVESDAWARLGGFDERFFMYGEDVDFAIRARAAGYRPVICPRAVMVHDVGKASGTPLAKQLLLLRGKTTLMRKHWSRPRRIAGHALLAAGVGIRMLSPRLARWRGTEASQWEALWRQRREWLKGFPEPERAAPSRLGSSPGADETGIAPVSGGANPARRHSSLHD